MDRGWVKSYRKQVDWEWYREPNTAHLFNHLVLMANRKDGKWRGIEVPRGCLITTFRGLADQTGLSVRNVRTALNHLISTHDVTQHSTKEYTLLKVENYDLYQGGDTESDTRPTHDRHTTDTRPTLNKKVRNKEREKEEVNTMSSSDEPDTAAQVIRYLNERAGKNFSEKSEANRKLISGRIREGRTIEDFKQVIDLKVSQWKGDEKMDQYLRPATLFRPQKFEEYLNEAPAKREMTKEELQAEYGGTWL